MKYPAIVSKGEWLQARQALLEREKEMTKALDALAAVRRAQPMVEITQQYEFESPVGKLKLVDLFGGKDQLIVYHNMLSPNSDHVCPGCSRFSDDLGGIEHLPARRTSFVMVSRAPLARIEAVKARFKWRFDWYSCEGTTFHEDFVTAHKAPYGLSVFIRQNERVFLSYFTTGRGIELASNSFQLLDLTPWGRQEAWQDLPDDVPREDAHSWLKLSDHF